VYAQLVAELEAGRPRWEEPEVSRSARPEAVRHDTPMPQAFGLWMF
jgi:hypothetical protein